MDQSVTIDGHLVGADEQAVYTDHSLTDQEVSGLWRFPEDGSPGDRVALSAYVPTGFGTERRLTYREPGPLLFADQLGGQALGGALEGGRIEHRAAAARAWFTRCGPCR